MTGPQPAGPQPAGPQPTGQLLTVTGLWHHYGAEPVLSAVSFTVRPGEVVAVIGPSGAGKTTLFRCLNRLIAPSEGRVELGGVDLTGLRGRALRRAQRRIGVIFQQFDLVRRRSAIENVLAGQLADTPLWRVLTGVYAAGQWREAAEALHHVGLAGFARQRADRLSGGQQQRVAIARALAQRSRLLLADEPVASLDPASSRTVLALLRGLADDHGIAVLCSLHQVELLDGFADRVLGLRDGVLVFDRRLDRTADSLGPDEREILYGPGVPATTGRGRR